jgi:hypothetical protein
VSTASAAPPNWTFLLPAGGQRGTTVEATAGGTFDSWPVQAWVDGTGVEVKALQDKGKLAITIGADATPGVYWLRLYNDEGGSVLRSFIVGTLPEVLEQEPNDDPRKPQTLESTTVVVNGRLEKTGEVDGFAVKLTKGQTLVAALEANHVLGSPMDAILQVLSADGFVLDQNNDYRGLDPQLVFVPPADGTYLIRTFAFPATPDSAIRFAGGADFVYRLTLTTGGFVDHPFPLAVSRSSPGPVELHGWGIPAAARQVAIKPADGMETASLAHPELANTAEVSVVAHAAVVEAEPNDLQQPQPIELPATISGRIERPGDVDVYQLQATKGQVLVFRVDAPSQGALLGPPLRLLDAAGKLLAQTGEGRRATSDGELTFTVPADGPYRLVVQDLYGDGGPHYVYRLQAVLAEPDFVLRVAADRFVLTPGKPLDIPITIDRRHGFAGEIEITAEMLPAGVTAAPAKSEGTGRTAKMVTLRLSAGEGPLSMPIAILGKAQPSGQVVARQAQFVIPNSSKTVAQLWLTVARPPGKK